MNAFTVEIQASNASGDVWQAMMPAEIVRTNEGDNDAYDTEDGAFELARDVYNNQNVAEGAGVRVCVWHGDNADTGSDPDVVYAGLSE
jgi:hypothetical protein